MEFDDELQVIETFWNVGKLKELLDPYPNDTPIYVCDRLGLFNPNEEEQCIYLNAVVPEPYWDDCATEYPEYIDF